MLLPRPKQMPNNNPDNLYICLTHPTAWDADLNDELAYRVERRTGNARLNLIIADAVLSAPVAIPPVPPIHRRDKALTPTRDRHVTLGPTGRDKMVEVRSEGWRNGEFVRSALRYYLDMDPDERPRCIPGSDHLMRTVDIEGQ